MLLVYIFIFFYMFVWVWYAGKTAAEKERRLTNPTPEEEQYDAAIDGLYIIIATIAAAAAGGWIVYEAHIVWHDYHILWFLLIVVPVTWFVSYFFLHLWKQIAIALPPLIAINIAMGDILHLAWG